jgi:predicted chitinase
MPRWTMNLKTQHATGPARISRASLQLARLVFAVAGVLVLTLAQETAISHAGTSLFTVQDIKKISPRADSSLAKALVDAADDLQKADIRDRLRTAHFIAQVMTETNGLSRLDENMRYRFETLLRVFSRTTISELKAREIAGREQDIANWVYGNRLGNRGRHTQDGWNYRGSGYIQLTGRDNFRNRGREISIDLEGNPERARMARDGLLAAIAYWKAVNVNRAADNNDLLRVRLLVNGPKAHGYEQSRYWFRQSWCKVFKDAGASGNEAGEELAEAYAEEDQSLFDSMMKNSGLISDGFESEADADTVRANGFKQLQKELGLTESGVLDEDTRYALLDPIEWRKLDDSQAASNTPSGPIGTDVYNVAEAPASTGFKLLAWPDWRSSRAKRSSLAKLSAGEAPSSSSSLRAMQRVQLPKSPPSIECRADTIKPACSHGYNRFSPRLFQNMRKGGRVLEGARLEHVFT